MLLLLLLAGATLGAKATPGHGGRKAEKAGVSTYTPPCTVDAKAFCTDKSLSVDLDQSNKIYLRLNTAIGDVVHFRFPEAVTFLKTPSVGNKAIYKLEASDHVLEVFVRPPAKHVTPEQLEGNGTVIHMDVRGGLRRWHITVDVVVTPKERAVLAVSFDSATMADEEMYVQRRINETTAALRKELEDTKAGVRQTALEMSYEVTTGMYAQGNACSDSHTPSARTNGLWGHVVEVCRTGDRLFVRFELRNGTRDRFNVGLVELIRGADSEGSEASVDSIVRFWDAGRDEDKAVETVTLAHRQTVQGAISSEAPDETDQWALRIQEDGGGGRTLVVDGLRF